MRMESGRPAKVCGKCGATLPPDAPQGFCPVCLLERAASEVPGASGESTGDYSFAATGMLIGRYKLLEQIGEGGFGVVYMAEQLEPVQRKVALKIIKAGMDTKEVIARFEAERQALALMDHPAIAQVYDGGMTPVGRPYFVMELVRGIPITKSCDQRNLDTKARLELFMQVCRAVQHAHQKGIIHRDLKPSNILVTHHESEPMPKIIDFGVAKALGQKLTDRTLFTGFLRMVGTPTYMSPEQAEFTGMDVDTRSDVYSLGVLLYELLTGVIPFDPETMRNAALDEVRRMIRETDPPKPSTRLETLGEKLEEIARQRHTEATKLRHALQGDLDWIVMKCLEKDRRRRYDTVNGLAMDVQRHLDDEPVVARPPSRIYEFQKTVKRHKFGFAATVVIILVLSVGIFASTRQAIRASRAEREQIRLRETADVERVRAVTAEQEQTRLRQQAESEKQKAQTEAARSVQVAQFMKDMLAGVGPSVARGRDTELLHEVLGQTAQRLGRDLGEQPEVEAELRNTLGAVYRDLGEYEQAAAMHRGALEIQKRLFGAGHLDVAQSLDLLGLALHPGGHPDPAESAYREALAIRKRQLGDENLEVAATLTHLGSLLRSRGTLGESVVMLREALRLRRELLPAGHPDIATSLANLAMALNLQGKTEEAEACSREALAIRRQVYAPDHPKIADSLHQLACVLEARGRYAEAETNFLKALEIQQKVLGDHRDTQITLIHLASMLADQERYAEAERRFREADAMLEKVSGKVSDFTSQFVNLLVKQGKVEELRSLLQGSLSGGDRGAANAWTDLGLAFRLAGKPDEAEAAYRKVLEIQSNLYGSDSPEAASALVTLSEQLQARGELNEAQILLEEALTICRTRLEAGHRRTSRTLEKLINVLARQGQDGQLKELCQTEAQRLIAAGGHPNAKVAAALDSLGHVLWLNRRYLEAEKYHRSALAEWESVQVNGGRELAHVMHHVGDALRDQGKLAEAAGMFHQALLMQRRIFGDKDKDVFETLECLSGVQLQQGELEEAESLSRELLETFNNQEPRRANALLNLANVLAASGRAIEAESLVREALDIQRRLPGDNQTAMAGTLAILTDMLLGESKYQDAEPPARECLAIREKELPDSWLTFNAQSLLGGSLLGLRRYEEAEPLLISGYEGMTKRTAQIPYVGRTRPQEALQRLIELYIVWNKPDLAAKWQQRKPEAELSVAR